MDGIRVEYPDGWGVVRASNTSANLCIRFEVDNEEALQRIANAFKTSILLASPDLEPLIPAINIGCYYKNLRNYEY